MRTVSKLTATAALALTAFAAAQAAGPVPRKAPEFVILSPDGKQTLLSSYRGKTVVLAFMFTTCTHCQHLTGTVLVPLQKEYANKDVQVLGATFNPTAKDEVKMFNQIFKVNFPCGYASNDSVLQFLQQPANEPPFVPIVLVIDKNGMIREQHIQVGDPVKDAKDKAFFESPETALRADLDKLLKSPSASAKK